MGPDLKQVCSVVIIMIIFSRCTPAEDNAPIPEIYSVWPSEGFAGTKIEIHGRFLNYDESLGWRVNFNSENAELSSYSLDKITVLAPEKFNGETVSVSLRSPTGVVSAPASFYYLPVPEIVTVDPKVIIPDIGTKLVVKNYREEFNDDLIMGNKVVVESVENGVLNIKIDTTEVKFDSVALYIVLNDRFSISSKEKFVLRPSFDVLGVEERQAGKILKLRTRYTNTRYFTHTPGNLIHVFLDGVELENYRINEEYMLPPDLVPGNYVITVFQVDGGNMIPVLPRSSNVIVVQ